MDEAQYNELKDMLKRVLNNQVILGEKLNNLYSEVGTAIDNTRILGRDQDTIMGDLRKIKRTLNI